MDPGVFQEQATELRRLSQSKEYEKLQQQGVVLMGFRKVPLERRVSIANPYAAVQEFQNLYQDRSLPPLIESKLDRDQASTAISRVN